MRVRWVLFVFCLWMIATPSWAVDIYYLSTPSLRQYTTGGATIEMMMDDSTGSDSKIRNGIARFKIKKISGNFITSGAMDIYQIGNTSPVATVNYYAGASETGFVNFSLANAFNSGSKRYYAQRQGDTNVISGAITVTAEPQYPLAYALTVTKTAGIGTVSATPSGITNCATTCTANYEANTSVTLAANDGGLQVFDSWGGDCAYAGTNPTCVVTMSSVKNVTFAFKPKPADKYNLTIDKSGSGTVTSNPSGIDCGSTCIASFTANQDVSLLATPSAGFVFVKWRGVSDCTGTNVNTCSVLMSSSRWVAADFTQPPVASISNVVQNADGSLTVNFTVSDPEGNTVGADVYLSNAGGSSFSGREATKRSTGSYNGGNNSITYSATELSQFLTSGQTYTVRLEGFDAYSASSGYKFSAPFVYAGKTSPKVSSVTPMSARLDVPQNFIVTGTDLTAGMGFAVEDCESVTEQAGGSSTQRTFRCTPRLPGVKAVVVKTAPSGTSLFDGAGQKVAVAHPSRTGNSDAAGIPSANGVSLWNGNFHYAATDMSVPSKGLAFTLSRSYNSYYWSYESERGAVDNYKPWRFNWDLKIGYVPNTGNKRLYVQKEDGSASNFFKDTDGQWYPLDQGNFDKLKGDMPQAGQTTVYGRDGIMYIFQNPDLGGKLLAVRDQNSNSLTLTYGGNGKVSAVTDAASRQYTFTYDDSNRLSKVIDFTGRYVQYTWETDTAPGTGAARERLKTVRDVRGYVTTYNYWSNNSATEPRVFLSSIVDPRGNATAQLTYSNTVYGNWGVDTFKDASNATWSFAYCAKQTNSNCGDPSSAVSFQTSLTTPLTGINSRYDGSGGSALVYQFDTAGRLVSTTNARGIRSEVTPTSIADLNARTYNTANLTQTTKAGIGLAKGYGFSYQYSDDKQGDLLKETNPENGVRVNTWNAVTSTNLHTLQQTVSPANITEQFTYDTAGHVKTQTVGNLPAVQMGYYDDGLLKTRLDGRGISSGFEYDAYGNLTQSTVANVANSKTYDALGRVKTETDPLGNVTSYTYDDAGNVTEVLAPMNRKTTYTYDENGNKVSMTDARGNTTTYTYNARNELVTTTATVAGVSVVTEYGYDALGRTTSVKNPNAHSNLTAFNPTGKPVSEVDPLSNITTFAYDDDDRVIKQTDRDGRVTITNYDKLGRVLSVVTDAGTQSYTYDADGRMKTATDQDGKTTTYDYDSAGRLSKVTDPTGAITTAGYDANGNQTSITDLRGKTTTFTYDDWNRRIQTTDPNGQKWTTTYDNNGNVKTKTAPGNLVTTYSYDAADRQTGITYPDGTTVTFTYDANDNRASMTDATGTTTYDYDELNRLKKVTDPQGKTITYAYDGVGNLKTLGYPNGKAVTYAYDNGERLISVTDWLGKTTQYTLNKSGQVTLAALGNGARTETTYDTSGRLKNLTDKQANGTVIASHGLTMDGRGNITNANTQLPLQPSLSNDTRSMTYDNANRLATFKGQAVNHDNAGRITGLSGNTYAYNGRDLITAISGTQTASFAYNGEGNRVSRTLNGQTTRYVIDPNAALPNVLAEADATGNLLRNYVYGYGLVEQISAANDARYYHFDSTGNTLALTDGSGAVTDTYAYTPFGETTAKGITPNPFRYVGKEGVIDDGNGLHYMRARYYRADIARFMSLDAIEGTADEPQGLNRYAYVRGNPISNIDPSGLYSLNEARADWETLKAKSRDEIAKVKNEISSAKTLCAEAWRVTYGMNVSTNDMDFPLLYRGMEFSTWMVGCVGRAGGKLSSLALDAFDPFTYAKYVIHPLVRTMVPPEDAGNVNLVLDALIEGYKMLKKGKTIREGGSIKEIWVKLDVQTKRKTVYYLKIVLEESKRQASLDFVKSFLQSLYDSLSSLK